MMFETGISFFRNSTLAGARASRDPEYGVGFSSCNGTVNFPAMIAARLVGTQ
jgi:hypothetical protein